MSKIRVLIADDHGIVRAGLRSLLEAQADMEVVGEASTGREAVDAACTLQPDVVLMDIGMPGMSGLEATRELRKRAPSIRVLALTIQESEEYFFAMLKAGASGYILKEAEPQELLSALRAVYQGGAFLSPAVAKVVLEGYVTRPKADNPEGLTVREGEVLRLAAQGHTNREIAESLCLSIKTVEKHRASMMDKLGLRGRQELIRYALRKGLIDLDEPDESDEHPTGPD
jgi:two-component system response regulator NreC